MTRKFILEIEMDNDAFQNPEAENPEAFYECAEVRKILFRLFDYVLPRDFFFSSSINKLRDSNGNTCGSWRIEECDLSITDASEPMITKAGQKQ
jgi:hypothetical protein